MAAADTARLIAQLILDDKQFQAALGRSHKGIGQLETRMSKVGGIAQKGIGNAVSNIEKGLALGAGAAVAGLAGSIKVASDFESQLNTINTVAGQTPEALGKIGTSIRTLSKETGVATGDLTTAYYDLVSAGVSAADAQGVLSSAVTLGIGGLASTAETVDLLTTALNIYGGGAKEAADDADFFAQAVAAGKVTAAEIAETFASVGPLAKSSGIEIEELAAGYAQLTAKGIPAAEAATAMRAAMLALVRTTAPLEKLQKKLNVNFADLAAEKGLATAYQVMVDGAKKYKIPLIDLVGRQEALGFALNVSGTNAAGYAKNLADVRHATDGAGVASRQAAERQKGLNFQLDKLKANVNDAAITIGTALIPSVLDLAKEFTGFIQGNQSNIAKFATDLANGIRDAAKWAKSLDWNLIGNSLKAAGTGARAVVDAFAHLPPWIQGAVLTGWGLNKLTGGALGSIVSELGKGLIKGVLGMTAGVVNLSAGTVTGAGAGVPGAAGATSGALGLASKVFIVGAAAGVFAGVVDVAKNINDGIEDQKKNITGAFKDFLGQNPTRQQIEGVIRAQEAIPASLNPIERLLFESNTNGVKTVWDEGLAELRRAATANEATSRTVATFVNNPSQHDRAGADEAAAKIATATATAIRTAAEQARAGRNRIDVVEGGGAKGLAVAADFVRIIEAGPGQWGQKLENQQRVLEAIRDAEKDARNKGDTVVAGKLDTLEQRLKAIIEETKKNRPHARDGSEGKDDAFVPSKKPPVLSPDARDHTAIDKLDAIHVAAAKGATATGEMRTEFLNDKAQQAATGNALALRLDNVRTTTANVQAGVVSAVNQMSANVTAAIAGIRLVPPTINVPRPPTPQVNVNITNRAVTTAVSRNTTFTRPL